MASVAEQFAEILAVAGVKAHLWYIVGDSLKRIHRRGSQVGKDRVAACPPRGGRSRRGRRRSAPDRFPRHFAPEAGPTVWAARYLAMNSKRGLIGSFWHCSMANTVAQAIGAQSVCLKRQVISLSGDGGFAMLMGDSLSLAQLGLPVKVVVFNNGALGFIELEQKSRGFLGFGTDFKNANFAALAESVGVWAFGLRTRPTWSWEIKAALAHDGPVLIDAVVNRQELAVPLKVTVEMAKDFIPSPEGGDSLRDSPTRG
jgi:Thiamine pyrophosphate enzyme, C-terminal TPP binding domain